MKPAEIIRKDRIEQLEAYAKLFEEKSKKSASRGRHKASHSYMTGYFIVTKKLIALY